MADRNATSEAAELFVGIKSFIKADFDPRLKQMGMYMSVLSSEITALRKMVLQQDQTLREQKKEIGILTVQFHRVNDRTLGKSGKPVKL